MMHGLDCAKASHYPGETGYLHALEDDGPYTVDGVEYCGRCHAAIDTPPKRVPKEHVDHEDNYPEDDYDDADDGLSDCYEDDDPDGL